MDTSNISSVTLRLQKDGSPLKNVKVSAFGQEAQTDQEGVATFQNVPGGKQTILVTDNDKSYSVAVYVISPDIDIAITDAQATTSTIPADRQIAYEKAADSMPFFIGMMLVFGVILLVVLYFFNKKFSFLPGIVRWFLQTAIVVVVLVAGIFITAYSNGSQDKLFAMISLEQSARASTDTIPQPTNVEVVPGKNSLTVSWNIDGEDTMSRAYLIRWGKNAQEVVMKTRMTNSKTTTFTKLDSNTEYRIEVQTLDISQSSPRLSNPVQVTGKTE